MKKIQDDTKEKMLSSLDKINNQLGSIKDFLIKVKCHYGGKGETSLKMKERECI